MKLLIIDELLVIDELLDDRTSICPQGWIQEDNSHVCRLAAVFKGMQQALSAAAERMQLRHMAHDMTEC